VLDCVDDDIDHSLRLDVATEKEMSRLGESLLRINISMSFCRRIPRISPVFIRILRGSAARFGCFTAFSFPVNTHRAFFTTNLTRKEFNLAEFAASLGHFAAEDSGNNVTL